MDDVEKSCRLGGLLSGPVQCFSFTRAVNSKALKPGSESSSSGDLDLINH